MLKKKMILSAVSILCVCLLVGGYFFGRSISSKIAVSSVSELKPDVPDAPDRELVDPSEKVLLSDEWSALSARVAPPSLELYASLTAPKFRSSGNQLYVVQGKILSQENWNRPILSDEEQNEAMKNKLGGTGMRTDTLYTIQLEEVWYGDIPETQQQIQAWVGGDEDSLITKPNVGEHVVLFLVYGNGRTYYSFMDLEHGIFTVNDDGTLYSFSNEEALYQYDGQPVQVLIDDLYQAIEEAQE